MLLQTVSILGTLLLGSALTNASAVERGLTRAKLAQFTGTYCDDKGGDTEQNRISRTINPSKNKCIDIDGKTHTIFLARGTGLVNRRKMVAYAQTGCPANQRITEFHEHDSGSACMSVDTQLLGIPGSSTNQGRIMSVKFIGF